MALKYLRFIKEISGPYFNKLFRRAHTYGYTACKVQIIDVIKETYMR